MKKFAKSLLVVVALCAVAIFAAGCGKMSLEDYVASDAIRSYVDSTNESSESSGIKMEILADGDKLIYEYTYTDPIDEENVDAAKEMLDSAMEQEKSTFEGVVDALSESVDVQNPSVTVRYLNADGSVITEAVFD